MISSDFYLKRSIIARKASNNSLSRFGSFFCPLLPLLGCLRVIVIFHLQKFTTLKFCEAPLRAFKAHYSFTELFYFVLLVMLFCVAFPLGWAITR
jgi:hypothetical protein